jgi:cytochrome b pre-mRNA-processing protein 3
MLDFLFRRLTAESPGAPLFDSVSAEARRPHWYVEGKVPDTLDGRFAVLATILGLTVVRLEQDEKAGNAASVALTERFIEVMESEHRELGLGDPTLGKTVRRLVASLGRRTELWRSAIDGERAWITATRESLYKDAVPADALDHSAEETQRLWAKLETASLDQLKQGKL